MKFYKVNKNILKWNENVPVVNFNWKTLPILVDIEYNVIAGNSVRNNVPEELIIIQADLDSKVKDAVIYYETKIAEENKITRYHQIEIQVLDYLREIKKPEIEWNPLFEYEELGTITEDNYIAPSEEVTYAHGIKKDVEEIKEELEFDIDLELLKELL